jgi:excisionase family DNA binding protein
MSTSARSRKKEPSLDSAEVLTLPEAAAYLRVSEKDILKLATKDDLPGRRIGSDWRFLKQALADWLHAPSPRGRLLRHAGAAKDDPYLNEMLEQIYRQRGRPMIGDDE